MANLSNINNKFLVTTGGDVGIGITAPLQRLHVHNASGTSYVHISNNTTAGTAGSGADIGFYTGQTSLQIINRENDSVIISTNDLPRVTILGGGDVGIGVTNPSSYWANANNLVVGGLGAVSGITIATDGNLTGSLIFADSTAPADNTRGGLQYNHSNDSMLFRVDNDTKMTILSSGNVGIGATDPSFQLSIENHATTTSVATFEIDGKRTNGTDGPVGEMIFSNNGDTFATVAGFRDGADNKGSLQFQTQDSTFATRMTISSEGNVGIGTTSPMSGTNNLGLQIAKGAESSLFMGNPQGGQGAVFQTSDNRHRAIIGANVYDDPSSSWNVFTSGKGIAGISILADTGGWGTGIDFWCGDTDSIISRMNISSNGNVNIGTTYAGSSAVTGPFVVSHTSSRFLTSSYESSIVSLSAKNNNNNLESLKLAGDSIYFFNGTNTTGSQSMVILNSGNVGIGTTVPQNDKLHVETDTSTVYDGNSNQTGGLFVNNIYHEALNTFSQIRLGVSGASGASTVRLVGIEPSQAASDFAIVLRNGSVWGEKLRIKGATGRVGIGTNDPQAALDISSNYSIQGGVRTYAYQGTAAGTTNINLDITVGNEGGQGNVFKIEAGFAHYYAMNYNSVAEWWCTSRGTAVINTYILNAGTTLGGDWSASKPSTTVLRITKSAGTYGGTGKYWVKVTYVPF